MPNDIGTPRRGRKTRPTIRRIRRDDIPAVVDMVGCLAEHHGDAATLDAATLERDAFGTRPWVGVLVAEHDRDLVGYAVFHPLYAAQFGRRGLELQHLYVAPAWRGAGVGRGLIAAVVARARRRRCDYVSVGTSPDNLGAQAYYPRLGFEAATCGPRFWLRLI